MTRFISAGDHHGVCLHGACLPIFALTELQQRPASTPSPLHMVEDEDEKLG
ncbi:MAG: hypothetical protein VW553_03540 [Alphaproteobacteria bacterium]